MKKFIIWLIMPSLALFLYCCGDGKQSEKTVLARINDYNLLLDDFLAQLAQELEFDKEFKLTRKAKETFLEEIIRKELLIQEAKRMNLDRKEEFIRAIERYWEATLIRDIMEVKGREISSKTVIAETEIKNEYEIKYQSRENKPELEAVREQIIKHLKEKKKTESLKNWIMELRKNADIKINEDILYSN